MESLFSKVVTSLSLILSLITGSYISINIDQINIDYETGDNTPIYYTINIENIGSQRAKYQIINNDQWIFVYREYQPNLTHVDMSPGSAANFIAEIYPNQLDDGMHETEIEIRTIHLNSGEILDTQNIPVTINKNIQEAEEVVASPQPTEIDEVEPTIIPTPETTTTTKPTPVLTKSTPVQTITPSISPMEPDAMTSGESQKDKPSFFRSFINLIRNIFL